MRGATRPKWCQKIASGISIHAPLAGRDPYNSGIGGMTINFNPRAPCGARHHQGISSEGKSTFQSTRPLRGATSASAQPWMCPRYFNPRAPCGARRFSPVSASVSTAFQSTRPLRGATSASAQPWMCPRYFNPRAPCGARRFSPVSASVSTAFQSTRPLRGATDDGADVWRKLGISIHAPLAGRDRACYRGGLVVRDFNPRAPCGARLVL